MGGWLVVSNRLVRESGWIEWSEEEVGLGGKELGRLVMGRSCCAEK